MILIITVGRAAIVTVVFIVGFRRWESVSKEMRVNLEALYFVETFLRSSIRMRDSS